MPLPKTLQISEYLIISEDGEVLAGADTLEDARKLALIYHDSETVNIAVVGRKIIERFPKSGEWA